VDGRAHERALNGPLPLERAGEIAELEGVDHRPEPDVRRGRVLRLQAADPLERSTERHSRALEQELAREQRPVQPARREDHGRTSALR
jgi:hypothetical protein